MPDLLHLTTTSAWNDAQGTGVYPIPGGGPYIHLCHPDQLTGVVERFFPEAQGDIVVLTVDPDGLRVVLESGDDVDGVFPHLYGELPIDNVTDVRPLGVVLDEPGDADGED